MHSLKPALEDAKVGTMPTLAVRGPLWPHGAHIGRTGPTLAADAEHTMDNVVTP